MIYKNFTRKQKQNQLTLPGFCAAPGYPIKGIMRVIALCEIYGWPYLGALAMGQLAKAARYE